MKKHSATISKTIFACALACATVFPSFAQTTAGPDLTKEYAAALTAKPERTAKLKQYKLLFVPGFLSDGRSNYFGDQLAWAKNQGIDALRVKIESENSPAQNALAIAREIRNSDKPVILITHSKGGLDALETLVKNPDLRNKVKGWLAMQAPFYGSPLADHLYGKPLLHNVCNALLCTMGGNIGSLNSLRVATRKRYMRENAAEIAAITASVPILCFACWTDGKVNPLTTLTNFNPKEKNDGEVPLSSQLLPAVPYVLIPGVVHNASVSPLPFVTHDRANSLKASLLVLLK